MRISIGLSVYARFLNSNTFLGYRAKLSAVTGVRLQFVNPPDGLGCYIPGEIRFITSHKDAGIGITAFDNLNAKRSFAGINLSLHVGQMKK